MKRTISYKSAGVNIDKADGLISALKRSIKSTRVKGSVGSIGGFGGFFDAAKYGVKRPLLVAATDGVGTKLKIAINADKNDTVGIDLVAMSVNDCVACGARPLFFLDYFASGKLKGRVWKDVLSGIIAGCRESDCALLGGETAELPGMYAAGDYDLAGFAVGIVDKKKIITGSGIKPGDAILGIASSGLHSNGYSLVRKIFTRAQIKKNVKIFLEPTRIYVKGVLAVTAKIKVKGIAHITGGGFYDNISRILPKGARAVVYTGSWDVPEVFKMIEKTRKVSEKELYRTFNMGIGMALVLPAKNARAAQNILRKHKLKSWTIGEIVKGRRGVDVL